MAGLPWEQFSAVELATWVHTGQISAQEIVACSLRHIEATEPGVHAFLEVTAEAAQAAAQRIDDKRARGIAPGMMAGVPVAFKNNMNYAGTTTNCGSRMLENYVSPYTATCVSRLLEQDALPMGKTNMDEFAFGSSTESSAFGNTYNPWNTSYVPGGSSGGSAAAVAAGSVTVSLGTDTGGSIRQPASFCGVFGMKPTYGTVSRYGVVAFGSSLDQVGPFGRCVPDVALTLDALTAAGRDSFDTTNVAVPGGFLDKLDGTLAGKKVGIVRSLLEVEGLTDEVRDCVLEAAQILEDAGAQIVDVELPHLDAAISAYYVIAPCEAFSNLARFDGVRYGYQEPGCTSLAEQTSKSRSHGFGQEAKRRQMLGAYLLSSGVYDRYFVAAQKCRTLITDDYHTAFSQVDVLLMPSAPRTAFKLGEMSDPTQMYATDLYTISNNIAGNCGMSVPLGLGAQSGMPVSVQLQGAAFQDQTLLNVAYGLDRAVYETTTPRSFIKTQRIAPSFEGVGGVL